MSRTPSYFAQATFDLGLRLQSLFSHPSLSVKLFASAAYRVVAPIAKQIGANHTVMANVYGRTLTVPAEHPLPAILLDFPHYNKPLSLAIQAIENVVPTRSAIAVIDVGANVGDTAAIIEQRLPNLCSYLCIEPDRDMAAILRSNYPDDSRVQIEACFIGEEEGAPVRLEDDGRANPSTKLAHDTDSRNQTIHDRLVRLDTIALPFAQAQGHVDLIKVDTEGYDFSVLRSGSQLLDRYKPSLFLEWYPQLLAGLSEEVWNGFEYLNKLGYQDFVFFTNEGDFYCRISRPDRLFLRSLASVTFNRKTISYFDVFASASSAICDELAELSIHELALTR